MSDSCVTALSLSDFATDDLAAARATLNALETRVAELRQQQVALSEQIDRLAVAAKEGLSSSDSDLPELAKQKSAVDVDLKRVESDLILATGNAGFLENKAQTARLERTLTRASDYRSELIFSFRATCELWGRFLEELNEAATLSNLLRGPFGAFPHNTNRIQQLAQIDPFAAQRDDDLWAVKDFAFGIRALPALRPMVPIFGGEKNESSK
jgi:hypothetical protein